MFTLAGCVQRIHGHLYAMSKLSAQEWIPTSTLPGSPRVPWRDETQVGFHTQMDKLVTKCTFVPPHSHLLGPELTVNPGQATSKQLGWTRGVSDVFSKAFRWSTPLKYDLQEQHQSDNYIEATWWWNICVPTANMQSKRHPIDTDQLICINSRDWMFNNPVLFFWLVVEPNPSEKYESQLGWLFPIYGKS
jgi:hypothetical protein